MGQGTRISAYQRPVNLLEIANRKVDSRLRGNEASKVGTAVAGAGKGAEPFSKILDKELAGGRPVSVSKHAGERLFSRGLEFGQDRMSQVADALDKAEAKGSRETLILFDDLALVASVKNRTIITAFDRDKLREGVVTSIDSAVIL